MKKLLGPLLAASLATPACMTSNTRFDHSLLDRLSCETKECILKNVLGVEKEGQQTDGALVACTTKTTDDEKVIRAMRMLYAELHECQNSNPDQPLPVEVIGSHFSKTESNFAPSSKNEIICAKVNNPDKNPCDK